MFRAALASAGAHEAAAGHAGTEVLHKESAAVVARHRGHRRLHLAGLPQHRRRRPTALRLRHLAAADHPSPRKSRVSTRTRRHKTQHRPPQGKPESPRQSLHPSLPNLNPNKHQQKVLPPHTPININKKSQPVPTQPQ